MRFVNGGIWLFFGLLVARISYVHLSVADSYATIHLSTRWNATIGLVCAILTFIFLVHAIKCFAGREINIKTKKK